MNEFFRKFSKTVAKFTGNPYVFMLAFGMIAVWLLTGPAAGFSDEWQLIMNTITSIITFLMVFIIQNSQNRDTKAIQLKLDAILLGLKEADKDLIDLEDLSDQELEKLDKFYSLIAEKRRKAVSDALTKRKKN
jgi:low affinity Fe/Cu permease